MSLLEASRIYSPKYLDFVELSKKHEKVHWMEDEVKLGVDVEQWKTNKITDDEKKLVLNILRLFTQADTDVGQAYYDKLIPVIKNNEARSMLGSFAAREAIHQRAYALLSDTLGFGEEFYWEFLEYHEMKEKHEFMIQPIGTSYAEFAKYLAKQTMIEGVTLFASFAALLNFDRLGKLPGMCDVVRWSMIDETIHIEGNCALFRTFLSEHPKIVNDEFKKEIYETARELVALENSFIDLIFKLGGVSNLDPDDLKEYVKYVTDYRLTQLGLKPNWNLEKNPLPWIDHLMNGRSFQNFFERNVTEYEKDTFSGSFETAYSIYSNKTLDIE
jgi:glutaredoxin 3